MAFTYLRTLSRCRSPRPWMSFSTSLRRYRLPKTNILHRRYYCNENTNDLFNAIADLNYYGIKLDQFPNIICVGPQSSGKSSVVEGLCGHDILPKHMGMATKKETNITTLRSKVTKFQVNGKDYLKDEDAKEEINRLNNNPIVTSINIKVSGPDLYNSNFTDLPGLFYVSNNNPQLPKEVLAMTEQHMKNKDNIVLLVTGAPQDPATNQALQLINEHGRDGDAVGVITKADMVSRQRTPIIEAMLKGKKYELGFGYVAVVLRNKNEIEDGMTVAQKIVKEKDFFKKHNRFKPSGIVTLRKKISDIQFEKMRESMTGLISSVDEEIEKLEKHQGVLNSLSSNNQSLSIHLQSIIEKLVGSSYSRTIFEKNLAHHILRNVNTVAKDHLNCDIDIMKKRNWIPDLSSEFIDQDLNEWLDSWHFAPSKMNKDRFRDKFIYGDATPSTTYTEQAWKSINNENLSSGLITVFNFINDDPTGEKRMRWNQDIRMKFNRVHKMIPDTIYNTLEWSLLNYINREIEDDNEMTKNFARYLIEDIGREIYEDKMKFMIGSLLEIEKRPNIELFELTKALSYIYEDHLTWVEYVHQKRSFFSSKPKTQPKQKIDVHIYSQEWTKAYMNTVITRFSNDCFRVIAVKLLDGMVARLLERTFDTLDEKHNERQANKVIEKVDKLKNIRNILSNFCNRKTITIEKPEDWVKATDRFWDKAYKNINDR